MFVCHFCNEAAAPKTKPRWVVLEKRPRQYPARKDAHKMPGKKSKKRRRDDPGGQGWEIAHETMACPDCASKHQDAEA